MSRPSSTPSRGARLVAEDGRELLLRSVELHAKAQGGFCRVEVRQRWANPYAEPLRVHYQLPLPADAAVSGYSFTVGERTSIAKIARKQEAREAFEEAVAQGHSAALLDQERSSLFTQELGNIPPGEEIIVRVELDQPLSWNTTGKTAGQWEWRFPTVIAPRYLGAPGRFEDAEAVTVGISEAKASATVHLSLQIGDPLVGGFASSPSHVLSGQADALSLGRESGSALDRDVVVRWPVAANKVGVSLRTHRPAQGTAASEHAYGLVTIVPPRGAGDATKHPRDLCVLIDVSGSMGGEPLGQARRVISALVHSLDEGDQLELIAFSWQPERWKKGSVAMSPRNKKAALSWLRKLSAGGATEMRGGIIEALAPLRAEAQRQVLIVSDGLIGFESEIVAEIRNSLPTNSRVHTLGVGHAVNRSLTGPAARAGGGLEAIIAPGEDVEPIVASLLARTVSPQLVDLEFEGEVLIDRAPLRTPDLFGASPVRVSLCLRPEGGTLTIRARAPGGSWTQQVEVPAVDFDSGGAELATLYGRECVEDLELVRASGEELTAIDPQIEAHGLRFAISTRHTSWIAVDEEPNVDLRSPTRSVKVPHMLAAGLSAQGVGLRPTKGILRDAKGVIIGVGAKKAGPNIQGFISMAAPRAMVASAPPPPIGEDARGGARQATQRSED